MALKNYNSCFFLSKKESDYLICSSYIYQGLILKSAKPSEKLEIARRLIFANVLFYRELSNKQNGIDFFEELANDSVSIFSFLPTFGGLSLEKEKNLAMDINISLHKEETYIKNTKRKNFEVHKRENVGLYIVANKNATRLCLKILDFNYFILCGDLKRAFALFDYQENDKNLINYFLSRFERRWRYCLIKFLGKSLSKITYDTKIANRTLRSKIMNLSYESFSYIADMLYINMGQDKIKGLSINVVEHFSKSIYEIDNEYCFYYTAVLGYSLSSYHRFFASEVFDYICKLKGISLMKKEDFESEQSIRKFFGDYIDDLGIEHVSKSDINFIPKEIIKYA